MRMDRYEEENKMDLKQTRTNKNQELYTDVYLNNVYVDINNLKEVMQDDDSNIQKDEIKVIKENKLPSYTYQDKIYDINVIIQKSIENKKDDKIKRSIDTRVDDLEIASLIESINENKEEKDILNEDKNLLTDLLPTDDNTSIVLPLENPIVDEKIIENYEKEEKGKEQKERLEQEKDLKELDILKKDLELDDSFVEHSSRVKIVLVIFIILLIIGLTIGFLLYKDII